MYPTAHLLARQSGVTCVEIVDDVRSTTSTAEYVYPY